MKKLGLAIIALSLLLPIAAEARGKKVFNLTNPQVTPPQFISGDVAKLPEATPTSAPIVLRIVVEKDGSVLSYGSVDRSASPKAIKAAEKAVEQWRFKPATKSWAGGCTTPVRVRMVVEVPVGR